MKTLFTVIALGSLSMASADQYYQGYGSRSDCPNCNDGRSYQGQYHNSNDYQRGRGYDYQNQQPNSRMVNDQYSQQDGVNRGYYNDQQNNSRRTADDQQTANEGRREYLNDDAKKNNSDRDIGNKIHETLSSGWFSKGFEDVKFDVSNGNVNLSGSVDTLENKRKVEDSVRKIDGVKQVNSQISIMQENANANGYSDAQLEKSEKNYSQDSASTYQDRQLNAKIRAKLSNWFSKGNELIVIRTANGLVVITGTVEKDDDAKKIGDKIKEVEGVKSVDNQLSIRK